MKELKKGQSIFSFKKGDIIIKLSPTIFTRKENNENLGISMEVEVGCDNSLRHPLEFISIENNIIYLRELEESPGLGRKYVYKATLEDNKNDWALFVVPEGLTMEDCL